ncbi:MAG TPA: DHA2 family efflux MFS transporter permease subunit [Noviherbaspirillum sp.]|uniref:DHA2 family efflux MFS transporter permease subunit n=1 Tax=Noviherbaspirillum sp. TaxID=1926288 RepID=UPI002F93980D
MSAAHQQTSSIQPLEGGQLVLAALLLAAANFIVVLDTTIANVSVPNIAGGLGASASQGTLVITSYAVAEAITVPLTGWLANRFGTVRVFITSMVLFGLFSVLCGLAPSLGALVVFRIMQGLAGGPLMPLSQTILLRIFPKEKAPMAIGLWSMTTLVAPILGPVLGGKICDQLSWHYIFLINAPIAAACAYFGWQMLKRYETEILKTKIDAVGLGLLIIWISALQIMLDEGRDLDWFASTEITVLAIVAAIGFAAFMIWELTEKQPIVDLRVFRHRGYTMSVLTISLAFGAFFGSTVLTPQWLQTYMGYTATQAGYVTALSGVLAVIAAPFAAKLSAKWDPRALVFFGVVWLGAFTLLRTDATTEMTFWQIGSLLLLQGVGLPFFFVPLTGLALSSVDEPETASAAGLMNFVRTVSGAFATSLVTTVWGNQITRNHAELAGLTDASGDTMRMMTESGMAMDQARAMLDQLVQAQSVMLATNQVFLWAGLAFILAATAIWFAPKPTRVADTSAAH